MNLNFTETENFEWTHKNSAPGVRKVNSIEELNLVPLLPKSKESCTI